jgi:hypothetical protein
MFHSYTCILNNTATNFADNLLQGYPIPLTGLPTYFKHKKNAFFIGNIAAVTCVSVHMYTTQNYIFLM